MFWLVWTHKVPVATLQPSNAGKQKESWGVLGEVLIKVSVYLSVVYINLLTSVSVLICVRSILTFFPEEVGKTKTNHSWNRFHLEQRSCCVGGNDALQTASVFII